MAKKYKGVAEIELTDIRTGKKTKQIEENIVTNAIANILTQNPWGAINFQQYTNVAKFMSGIMLFDKTINENVNNTMIPFNPVSWAGDDTNTGSSTVRGSINNPACIVTETGIKLVWEWNTSQGNGTYKCIGLTHPSICNTDDWGDVDITKVLGYNRVVTYPPYGTVNDDYRNYCIGSTVIYDDKNGYFYKPIVSVDGKTITLTRATRPCHKNSVGLTNHWDKTVYDLNNGLGGKLVKDLRTVTKTVETSLTFDQSAFNRNNMISVSFYNNIIYLFSLKQNSPNVIVTKIDVSGDFTENSITISQNSLTFQSVSAQVSAYSNSQSGTQIKDCICFKSPYLYVPNNAFSVWKCNIDDEQDITLLPTSNTKNTMANIDGIILGNYYINNNGYKINLSENKVEPANKSYFTNGHGENQNIVPNSINIIGNEFVRLCPQGGGNVSNKFEDSLIVNPYYLATINNVTPFTKTSSQSMKITYTITEVNS